ncbi:hypothetical protein P4O66_010150 [Electrophorus voltai]|uniref:Syntaxin N-terminal domain-containing protein n=1 Tax=Electrophorus voltai TaxID=2609070 RepID=A0AAD9DV05_9TELE|nr:hypothetical protein P4O66_010150 [Electrophorus voltai]
MDPLMAARLAAGTHLVGPQNRATNQSSASLIRNFLTIYYKRCQTKARRIVKDPTHPNNRLFSLLRKIELSFIFAATQVSPTELQDVFQETSSNIFQINANVVTLDKSLQSLGTSRDTAELRQSLHSTQQQTNKVITSTSQLIKQLSDIISGSSRQDRLRLMRLKTELSESVQRYGELQKKIADRTRALLPPAKKDRKQSPQTQFTELYEEDPLFGAAESVQGDGQQAFLSEITEEDMELLHQREEALLQIEVEARGESSAIHRYQGASHKVVVTIVLGRLTYLKIYGENHTVLLNTFSLLLQRDMLDVSQVMKDLASMVHEQGDTIEVLRSTRVFTFLVRKSQGHISPHPHPHVSFSLGTVACLRACADSGTHIEFNQDNKMVERPHGLLVFVFYTCKGKSGRYSIEDYIQTTTSHVETANQELAKASHHQIIFYKCGSDLTVTKEIRMKLPYASYVRSFTVHMLLQKGSSYIPLFFPSTEAAEKEEVLSAHSWVFHFDSSDHHHRCVSQEMRAVDDCDIGKDLDLPTVLENSHTDTQQMPIQDASRHKNKTAQIIGSNLGSIDVEQPFSIVALCHVQQSYTMCAEASAFGNEECLLGLMQLLTDEAFGYTGCSLMTLKTVQEKVDIIADYVQEEKPYRQY